MLELDRGQKPLGLGVAYERVVCLVVVSRRKKVMSLLRMEAPCFAVVRFDMNLARAAHWSQWHSIVIEIAVQMGIG